VPLLPDEPLVPSVPLLPDEPLVPVVPLVPLMPLVPDEPLVPSVPLVPLVPLDPLSPLSPVLANVKIQSSPSTNGLETELSTGETVILKYPEASSVALIVNRIKTAVSNNLLTFT
jgi:hypothetical protein